MGSYPFQSISQKMPAISKQKNYKEKSSAEKCLYLPPKARNWHHVVNPTNRHSHYKYGIHMEAKLSNNLTDKTVSTGQFTFCNSFA